MSDSTGASKIFDVSAKEREIIEWKAARRIQLRNEYLREKHSPNATRDGHIFDPAIQRLYSTNFSMEQYFRPTVRSFLWNIGIIVVPITLVAWLFKTNRDEREHRYRTGQVSYRDRDWKFV